MSLLRLLLLLFASVTSVWAQVAVAHDPVQSAPLSESTLRDILLGRITTWDDGSPIVLVLLDEPSATAATQKITGRDLPQLIRGWKRLIYAGNGAMPLVLSNVQSVLDEVHHHPGALTVLANPPNDPRLKIISLP